MKMKSLIIFLLIFLIIPTHMEAETDAETSLVKLDQISDEALQMVKLNRYQDAERLLGFFSDQFLTMTVREQLFSMDELRIVTVSYQDALEAVANNELTHEERVNKVTKLRLVTDAIISTHEPLWTGMEGQMLSALYDIKEAVMNGETDAFHMQLNSFLSLYEVVYPSLKIDVPMETMQQLDTRISYIDQYRPQLLANIDSQHELEVLEADLKYVFSRVSEDEADPSLWWVIISTGSIIIVTLSYVGWRKYHGDKRKEKSRSNRLND